MSSSEINIAVILPSRGLLFTETLKELLEELSERVYTIYWSHGNSLPNCFNKPLQRALKQPHSHILIVEDDMVIKKGTLQKLIDANADIIACDYPMSSDPSGTVLYDSNHKAIFTGTGFILIKKHVFDTMPQPIFKSNISWDFKPMGNRVKFTAKESNPKTAYGQHDITFGLYQYVNNKPIEVAKTILAQRRLVQKGTNASNNGTDEIIIIDKYKEMFSGIDKSAVRETGLLTEVLIDGKRVHIQEKTAQKLIEEGRAISSVIMKNDVIIDTNYNTKVNKAMRRVQ